MLNPGRRGTDRGAALRRRFDLLVLSDIHLGTPACRAAELNAYLKSVAPGRIVLNGDIVDMWDFRKGYWPESHLKVVRRLLKFAAGGTPVHYLPGNHDGALRRYLPLGLGELHLDDRLELDLDGVRTLFLHGDAADLLLGTPRWVARLGALSYDALEWTSNRLNAVRRWCGRPPRSLAATVKANLAAAQRHVARFEEVCARLAAERGCGAVVCGHIHVAADRRLRIGERSVRYLNSGDWVDSLTALEYDAGSWRVARWHELAAAGAVRAPELDETAAVGAA